MRWPPDTIDTLCYQWGKTQLQRLGVPDTLTRQELLGHFKRLFPGDHEEGRQDVNYRGYDLVINKAWKCLRPELRQTMTAQYIWTEIPVKVSAAALGFSITRYWSNLKFAKAFVAGYVTASINLESEDARPRTEVSHAQ